MNLDYLATILDESSRLGEVFSNGDLGAPVPGCDDWTVGDLAVHICDVQSWCTRVVAGGRPSDNGPARSGPEAAAAFGQITDELISELSKHDPEGPCWNFTSAAQTHAFWPRRQALEVAVHRWDGAAALHANPAQVPDRLALDVIDEFVNHLLNRVIDRDQISPTGLEGTLQIKTDCGRRTWTFGVSKGIFEMANNETTGDVKISGSAHDLVLGLYRRPGGTPLNVSGDLGIAERWQKVFNF